MKKLVACALVVAACAGPDELGSSTGDVISDQLHNGGVTGFFFLPPMVPKPGPYGDFVATATPTVSIDRIDGAGGSLEHLATFTMTTGPGGERVKAHLKNAPGDDGDTDSEGYFVARWRTKDFNLSPSATYRVTVTVPGRTLGYADIDVVATKKEFKSVDTTSFTPLIDDDVLRIKFRIDRPAVDRDLDGVFDLVDNCPTVANANQLDSNHDGVGDACANNGTVGPAGGTVTASDGAVLDIPHGALDRATQLSITRSAAPPPPGYGAIGPLYVLEPAGTVFARPVSVTLPLPAGTTHASIYWSRYDNTGHDAVGGKVSGSTITVQGTHFSSIFVGPDGGPYRIDGTASTTWVSANLGRSTEDDVFIAGTTIEALVGSDPPRTAVFDPTPPGEPQVFHIDNVPEGEFTLHTGPTTGVEYDTYFVDSTTAVQRPDLGIVVGGRSDRTPITASAKLALQFSNLDTWSSQDSLEYFSSEAMNWGFALPEPDASGLLQLDLHDNPDGFAITPEPSVIDRTKGDRMMVGQLHTLPSSNSFDYTAMTRATELPAFDLSNNSNVTVPAALQQVSSAHTLSLDWHGADIAAAFAGHLNPRSFFCDGCANSIGVIAVPWNDGNPNEALDGAYAPSADLLFYNDFTPGSNVNVGTMVYGDSATFGGRWANLVAAGWGVTTPFRLPGTKPSPTARTGDGYLELRSVQPSLTVDPQIGPPTGIKIDGAPFFDRNPWGGATPTISWSAPANAVIYVVTIRELSIDAQNRTVSHVIATLATTDTSIKVPAGLLSSTLGYAFTLQAYASLTGNSDDVDALLASPYKSANNIAIATLTSGPYGDLQGPPEAKIIQNGQSYPFGIVLGSDAIYWTERGDPNWEPSTGSFGRIWTASLDPNNPNPQVVSDNENEPTAIAIDEANGLLYWTNQADGPNGTVVRYRLSDGHRDEFPAPQFGLNLLVIDHDVYFSGNGIKILRPNDAIDLFDPMGTDNMATDGTTVFWTDWGDPPPAQTGRVLGLPIATPLATPAIFATGQAQAWDIQAPGDGYVYWSDQAPEQPFGASIHRAHIDPLGGDELIAEADAPESMSPVFAMDSQYVFFVDGSVLWKAPKGGGARTFVASVYDGGCPGGKMVVDESHHAVYWTDHCGQATYRASY